MRGKRSGEADKPANEHTPQITRHVHNLLGAYNTTSSRASAIDLKTLCKTGRLRQWHGRRGHGQHDLRCAGQCHLGIIPPPAL